MDFNRQEKKFDSDDDKNKTSQTRNILENSVPILKIRNDVFANKRPFLMIQCKRMSVCP